MITRGHILACTGVLVLAGAASAGMFSRLRGGQANVAAQPHDKAKDSNDAGAAAIRFQRQWEPKERAYSFLVPAGWTVEGGMFHVNPAQTGGPADSIDGKCDMTVKKDAAGTVMFRWLPTWNCCDLSQNPQFALTAGMFPVGSRYQGMEVRPLPDYAGFLRGLFRSLHPAATDVNVVELKPMPELGEIFRTLNKAVDEQTQLLGFPPSRYDAGGLIVEYTEAGTRFREGLVTCLVDLRAAAAMWSNQHTQMMRAPVKEARQWKPVLDIICQSVRLNPEWFARASRAGAQRAQTAQETMRYIQSIDQQIVEHRNQTHAEIRYEDYLTLTGQEDYVNPYTKEVERDTAEYKHRWTTQQGDMIYTNASGFNPNSQRDLNHQEWKLTPVRPR
ncbi:MAG: hypothetical protein MUC88_09470 [Planctomycetes bacterium]|nr:hypothetical protein [Planctomycetota bacterium]